MSVRTEDHTEQNKRDARRKASLALRLIVDGIDAESIPHTPMNIGDLRNNKFKQVLGLHGSITWRQHYAVFQETKQFSNYTTPGTGPHFAENAVRKIVRNSDRFFRQVGL